MCYKGGVIFGFIDKVIKLSYSRFHEKNLVDAINIFLNNSYLLPFIFSTIEERLKYHTQNNNIKHNVHVKEKFFTVPHIKSITESFVSIAYKCNCKLSYSIPNTLKNLITRDKDRSFS